MSKSVRILNNEEFKEVINDSKRVERVIEGLKKNPSIKNGIAIANYSDEGFACFEVIMNKPEFLILSFTGTAC